MIRQEVLLHPSRDKNLRTVSGGFIIAGLCMGFWNVIFQPYLVDFIPSESIFGLVMTFFSLFQIIPLIFISKVGDRIGRKRVYLAGIFLYIPSMVMFALAGHVTIAEPLFLIITPLLLTSLGFGINDPSMSSLIAESSKEEKRTSSFTIVNLGYWIATSIGPLVIRFFSEGIPMHYFFYGLVGGNTLLFCYYLFFLKEPLVIKDHTSNIVKQFLQAMKALVTLFAQIFISLFIYLLIPFYLVFRKRINTSRENKILNNVERELILFQDIFKNPGVKYAIGFFAFDSLVFGLSLSIFYGAIKYVYSYNETHIAMIQLVFNISTIICFIPLTKLSDKLKSNELITMSIIIGSLAFSSNIIAHFTLPEYRLYVLLVGWAGLGASVAFWVPGILTILTDYDKRRRAEIYGMVTGIKSLGWMPTAVIAGIILDRTIVRFGMIIPFIISLILLPIEIFLGIKFPVKEKEEKTKEKS